MAPHSRGRSLEIPEHPGAGTLFVYSSAPGQATQPPRHEIGGGWPPTWAEIKVSQEGVAGPSGTKKTRDISPDALLDRGIAEYSFVPAAEGGVLGRGKFSTVYKVKGANGELFALKHTPLHPHHPLIAARLLREPTLLAQLPAHPCLIGVEGWVRTPGHFYLIEQLASTHVPLPSHPLPLSPSRAAYILDQLVSVIRDCLHGGGRVCHRDLKGENVLVDTATGDILIIDLGLATHFSMSEPKLTTCCGSPAFHSPEIVNALNHPPGAITYFGPELDIWCIALTLLSLLTSTRFPLGPSHSSPTQMANRVTERLDALDKVYPPNAPWIGMKRILSAEEKTEEGEAWKRVRKAMSDFLQIDGVRRMAAFDRYRIGSTLETRLRQAQITQSEQAGGFKQVSFVPGEVKYTLPLYLTPSPPPNEPAVIVLDNPHREVEKRITSYLKYLFRTAGILYHIPSTPDDSSAAEYPTFQLVLPIPSPPITPPAEIPPLPDVPKTDEWWLSTLFRRNNRSASVPPQPRTPPARPESPSGKVGDTWTSCWAKVEFKYPRRRPGDDGERRTVSTGGTSRSRNPARSTSTAPTSPILDNVLTLPPLILDPTFTRRPGMRHTETSPELVTSATLSGASAALRSHRRPSPSRSATTKPPRAPPHHLMSPLSRQVSPDTDTLADDEKDAAIPRRKGSGASSRQGSKPPSRVPSRAQSRAGSRAASRTNSTRTAEGGGTGLQIATSEATVSPKVTSQTVASPEELLAALTVDRKASYKSEHAPLPSRRISSRRPTSSAQVIIHLSDPRAVPVIRKALDVVHAIPPDSVRMPAFTPRVPALQLEEEETADDGIPIRPLPPLIPEEPERGRPRSKEDRSGQSAGSSGSPANRMKGKAVPVGSMGATGSAGMVGSGKRSMTADGVRGA